MRRDCMKCEYCWIDVQQEKPDGCGYGVDGSRAIGTKCYKDNKLLKKY